MTGGRSHDSVTVATTQGIPVALLVQACRPIPARVFAPSTMVSKSGVLGPVRRCPLWTLSMKLSPFRPRHGLVRADKAIGCHLVAQRTLRAFLDPPRLHVGTGMGLPGGGTFNQWGVGDRRCGLFPLQSTSNHAEVFGRLDKNRSGASGDLESHENPGKGDPERPSWPRGGWRSPRFHRARRETFNYKNLAGT